MDKVQAVKWIVDNPSGVNGANLCDDDGDVGDFSNEVLLEKANKKDYEFFENEYVRFISRLEALATGFVLNQSTEEAGKVPAPDAGIDFVLLHKVCMTVQDMPVDAKTRMLENLQAYRERELDRMKNIVSPVELESNFSTRRKYVCRYLLILFCHDFLWESEQLDRLNIGYANYVFNLIKQNESLLTKLMETMTKEQLLRAIETFENSIALLVLNGDQVKLSPQTIVCINVLDLFHRSNKSKARIDQKDFVNETVSNTLNLNVVATQYYQLKNKPAHQRPFLILDFPWLFSTEAKVDVLQAENYCTQNSEVINQINEGLQHGNFNILNMQNVHLAITVRRDHVLEDSLNKLSNQGKNLKKPLKVSFFGEAGVDAGGVRKEFFGLLTTALFDPMYAMFSIKNVGPDNLGTFLVVQQPKLRMQTELRANRNTHCPGHLQLGTP